MDVNGTKFHLLLDRADWARATENGLPLRDAWERDRANDFSSPPSHEPKSDFRWNSDAHELTLQPQVFQFVAAPKDNPPDLSQRRGAARDRYGNWYWIDETKTRIKVFSVGSGKVTDFYPVAESKEEKTAGDFAPIQTVAQEPLSLGGLALTRDHYLVVGTLQPGGLLIFDLYSTGEPRRVLWQPEIAFAPFDMTARPAGGVFILDRENRRYWILDRSFNVEGNRDEELFEEKPDDFQPADDANGRRTHHAVNEAFGVDLPLDDPVSIEALADDSVLILDNQSARRFSLIHRYYGERKLDEFDTGSILSLVEDAQRAKFALRVYDIAVVKGEAETPRLFVASEKGNQTFAFDLRGGDKIVVSPPDALPPSVMDARFEPEPIPEYFPMRLFGGRALVAAGGRVYYDFGERWLPLVAQRRPRYVESGTLETLAFDGKEPGCVWHRLLIDGCLPPETSVEVWSRTAEEKEDLVLASWQREPAFYLRRDGTELPFAKYRDKRSASGDGTWELLLQKAAGRWLQLKLAVSGNGQRTPRLFALRIYYPRFSYLKNYLPAIYREDEHSASFLDRFLANLEGFYTSIEDKIAAVQLLFEVRSAPAEALDWLASWFGVALDPAWDEAKRRLFIKYAVQFFQYRGTLRGLRMALRLALDNCADDEIFAPPVRAERRPDAIRIVENYLTRRTPGIIPGDSTPAAGIRVVEQTARWNPSQGRDVLDLRWRNFRLEKADSEEEKFEKQTLTFSLNPPADQAELTCWQQFSLAVLGFVPSGAGLNERKRWQQYLAGEYGDIDELNEAHERNYQNFAAVGLPRGFGENQTLQTDWQNFVSETAVFAESRNREFWQDFLARRYRRIGALNDVYNTNWSGFEFVSLFDEIPATGVQLTDWYQFESIALAMHQTAHRFTVMLPVSPEDNPSNAERQRERLELVKRIVELEKPAHTVFDVRFFWNLFRIGEVRLGTDTLLGLGSRDPRLVPELKLGESYVGESRLATEMPEKLSTRYVLGSETLTQK